MKTMKGPGLFLAQFAGDEAPFNSLDFICRWAASLGYKGVQIPTYCDEIQGIVRSHGLAITELSTHLQGQLVAVHPAYDEAFDGFAAPEVRGNPRARQQWAVEQMLMAAKASRRLGLTASVTFSGALAWPFVYPWPAKADIAFELFRLLDVPFFTFHDVDAAPEGASLRQSIDNLKGSPTSSSITTRAISCCSSSTTSRSSISITSASRRFTPRMPSSILPGELASTAVMKAGSAAPDASGRWETDKWISTPFSPSSRNTATIPGPCWNGNAASSTRRTGRARVQNSLPGISSA